MLYFKHNEGKTNEDVDDILFKNSPNLHYFPNALSNRFPNLVALTMENCALKSLTQRDLLGLEKLEYLVIEGCQLKTLPSDLFDNMKKLKIISFKNNKLRYLTRKVFENVIDNAREIDLRENSSYCYYGVESLHYQTGKGSTEMFFQSVDSNFEAPLNENVLERHNDKMLNAINDLWTSKKYSDFTIVVDKKRFPVHRSILSAESSVFTVIFDIDMKEKQNGELIIEDFSAESVRKLKHFKKIHVFTVNFSSGRRIPRIHLYRTSAERYKRNGPLRSLPQVRRPKLQKLLGENHNRQHR